MFAALSSNDEHIHDLSIENTSKINVGNISDSLMLTDKSSALFTLSNIEFIKTFKTTTTKPSSTIQLYLSSILKVKPNEKTSNDELKYFKKDLPELPDWYYIPHLKFFKNTTRKPSCTCQSYLTMVDKPVDSSSTNSYTTTAQPIRYYVLNIPIVVTTKKPLCTCQSNTPSMKVKSIYSSPSNDQERRNTPHCGTMPARYNMPNLPFIKTINKPLCTCRSTTPSSTPKSIDSSPRNNLKRSNTPSFSNTVQAQHTPYNMQNSPCIKIINKPLCTCRSNLPSMTSTSIDSSSWNDLQSINTYHSRKLPAQHTLYNMLNLHFTKTINKPLCTSQSNPPSMTAKLIDSSPSNDDSGTSPAQHTQYKMPNVSFIENTNRPSFISFEPHYLAVRSINSSSSDELQSLCGTSTALSKESYNSKIPIKTDTIKSNWITFLVF